MCLSRLPCSLSPSGKYIITPVDPSYKADIPGPQEGTNVTGDVSSLAKNVPNDGGLFFPFSVT